MGGWAKALWSIFVILLPYLGVFIDFIVNGRAMGDRAPADAQQQQAALDTYVRQTAGTTGSADELAKLAAEATAQFGPVAVQDPVGGEWWQSLSSRRRCSPCTFRPG